MMPRAAEGRGRLAGVFPSPSWLVCKERKVRGEEKRRKEKGVDGMHPFSKIYLNSNNSKITHKVGVDGAPKFRIAKHANCRSLK
jgi:hypothetical protein